ncbi:Transcription elongation factor, GreA/GreB, C-term [Nitrosomonas cryotolerans]|uniref:Transcription elongation factor, GreA/GreB, C-term n=1 Tax=Nitrosomonas cryotolerans ATCC 49181 TaxID=1131553 RepID=A0A1N6FXH7_9PROT|nr:GreA/GreB family elongation factor [Nitrosomonas cryotolerans]SFP91888.1 Transcription elongation factor, GreA/GreB, C-term [Nitrosomonas cryotolerans]SIN99968.1 Transcription elongation factor, GreA/GreB, C-term [Nitrosomonas cryotolerans ATCC 49181]
MYSYFMPRERSLQARTLVYNTPFLLVSALEQFQRFAYKRNLETTKIGWAGPGCVIGLLDIKNMIQTNTELVMPNEAAPKEKRTSALSPLGSSLSGLEKGDINRVNL